jgi:hypothetical protein
MKTTSAMVETGDPICPKVECKVFIKFYSVLEYDRQILATLNRIKEGALNQLADNQG